MTASVAAAAATNESRSSDSDAARKATAAIAKAAPVPRPSRVDRPPRPAKAPRPVGAPAPRERSSRPIVATRIATPASAVTRSPSTTTPKSATWRISDFEKAMPVEKLRSWKICSRNAVPRIWATPPSVHQPTNARSRAGSGAPVARKIDAA